MKLPVCIALVGVVGLSGCGPNMIGRQTGEVVAITPDIRADIAARGLDPDEEICKKYYAETGSTIPKPVCATRAAWEAQSRAGSEGASDAQRKALTLGDPRAGD